MFGTCINSHIAHTFTLTHVIKKGRTKVGTAEYALLQKKSARHGREPEEKETLRLD